VQNSSNYVVPTFESEWNFLMIWGGFLREHKSLFKILSVLIEDGALVLWSKVLEKWTQLSSGGQLVVGSFIIYAITYLLGYNQWLRLKKKHIHW